MNTGIDSFNKILLPLFNEFDNLVNKGYGLSHTFREVIFKKCTQMQKYDGWVPIWVMDAGNTAESSWTKEMFETFVRNNNNEIIHRWLYYYDCDMLVTAFCDRLKMTSSLAREFYQRFPCESPCKMTDFKSATMNISSSDTISFACVNSIFIYLASSFDLLSKIYVELKQADKLDFSVYPHMTSRNVLLGNINKKDEFVKDTLFERPICINTILSIRDRIVHNGSFDFMQMVYDCYDGPNDHFESTILFPDMANGNFIASKNRRNFYSQSNRLNLLLPSLLKDVLMVIDTTVEKLQTTFK